MLEYKFRLPLKITINSKKISLNLNWYRNAHFYLNNQVKKVFSPIGFQYFKSEKFKINYHLTISNNRVTDFMNWVSVVDKYFLDWLKNMGMIKDDSIDHYVGCSITCNRDTSLKDHDLIAVIICLD